VSQFSPFAIPPESAAIGSGGRLCGLPLSSGLDGCVLLHVVTSTPARLATPAKHTADGRGLAVRVLVKYSQRWCRTRFTWASDAAC